VSVPNETSEITYTGDGGTVDFPVTFGWQLASTIVVKVQLDGETTWATQVEGTDYTLTGVLPGAGQPPSSGTVSFAEAPADLSTVWIYREVPFTQPTAFRTAGPFSAGRHENEADNVVFQTQQLNRRLAALEAAFDALDTGALATFTAIQVDAQFTVDADAVEDTFPLNVALPSGTVATGWKVVRVRDLTDADAARYEPVEITKAQQTGDNLVVDYISGLEVTHEYILRIEVLT
jgi:hypothetical protein